MKELTKAEEQVMKALWSIEKGFVSDVVEALPKPRPANTTVATIIRILEKKEFVSHRTYGKNHEYYPLVSKETYTENYIRNLTTNYFDNSFLQLVSFFANEKNLSVNELEKLKSLIDNEITKQKE